MAANRVILTTEQIISNEQVRRVPAQTAIPFMAVEAVVEVPYGCAPHECYGLYEPFLPSLDNYAKLTRSDPVAGVEDYLQKFVHEPKDWNAYLELLGMEQVIEATVRGRSIHND